MISYKAVQVEQSRWFQWGRPTVPGMWYVVRVNYADGTREVVDGPYAGVKVAEMYASSCSEADICSRTMPERRGTGWCPQCGPAASIDEDGCCSTCGCDAVGPGADEALALRAENERLRELLEMADRLTIEIDHPVMELREGHEVWAALRHLAEALNRMEERGEE